MGARLSQPRGPGGTGEAPVATEGPPPPSPKHPFKGRINSRTIVAPAAAFTMACILFVYARTSIRAAKENARRHRESDTGGEGLSLLNEHRRRHGMREKVEGSGNVVTELASAARSQLLGSGKKAGDDEPDEARTARTEDEERLRALTGKGGKRSSRDEG